MADHVHQLATLRGELREEKEVVKALEESKRDAERILSKKIAELSKCRTERDQARNQERQRIQEALEATAMRLDCDCPAKADEQLDNHAEECPFGVAARLIRSLSQEECDCDPDHHIAADCRASGCRRSRPAALDTLDPSGEEKCERCGGTKRIQDPDQTSKTTASFVPCPDCQPSEGRGPAWAQMCRKCAIRRHDLCEGTAKDGRACNCSCRGALAVPHPSGEQKSPLDDLRPASKAHLELVKAILLCLENGVYPETIRRFVDEELGEAVENGLADDDGRGEQGEEKRDFLVSVIHAIHHSDAVVDAALKRFEQVEETEGTRPALAHALDAAVFVARTERVDGAPTAGQWAKHVLAEHGEEAVPVGTKEQIERLTKECPECEADDSGGGVDEPPSAMSTCTNCVGGRVPATDTSKEEQPEFAEQEKLDRLAKEIVAEHRVNEATAYAMARDRLLRASSKEVGGDGE